MRVAIMDTQAHDREFLERANREAGRPHELIFFELRLDPMTHPLVEGFPSVCVFVNDTVSADVIDGLARSGLRLLALRSAGFNNVDLVAAARAGVRVVRVPEYSPAAVAEHAMGLMLSLNRKLNRAYTRVREGNFELNGLLGFDMRGKTVGIIGTGRIGTVLARIASGFGCRLLAYDVERNPTCESLGVRYVELSRLYERSDIISLHCPLVPQTHYMIDENALGKMKPGVMLINTSRGALIDTRAVIDALKSGRVAYLGLDVYEEESGLFFEDRSDQVILDDVFARLLTFPNVIVTGHQAFFTREALTEIAATTIQSISDFEAGRPLINAVSAVEAGS